MALLEEELTKKIIKAFYSVYGRLGHGFSEVVYERSMLLELREMGLPAQAQHKMQVYYKDVLVGDFAADSVVDDKVVLELKAVECIHDRHKAQLLNYLRASKMELGLVMNFGPEPEIARQIFENKYKK